MIPSIDQRVFVSNSHLLSELKKNQPFVCRLSATCRVNGIPVNRQTPRFLALVRVN